MTAMNKRNSQAVAGASIPEAIQEAVERPSNARMSSEPSANGVQSRRSEGSSNHSGSNSTPTSNVNGGAKANGRQTPPSPSRLQHRVSGTPYSANTQPQNLDAVAEIVVRGSRSASTSGVSGRPIEPSRSAPNFRQDYSKGGPEEFTTALRDSARRVIDNSGGIPPKLKVVTDPVTGKPSSSQSPRSAIDPRAGGNLTRRLAPAVPDKQRPRRNTTTTVHQISNPVVNPSALVYNIMWLYGSIYQMLAILLLLHSGQALS